MRTAKQAAASRLNGSRSRGPKTPEGKRRISINARRHGLLSKCVVLDHECAEDFGLLLQQHVDKLQPTEDIEFSAIEEMTASVWRLRRIWAIEKRLFEKTMDSMANLTAIGAVPDRGQGDRMASAFSRLAQGPELHLLGRYESRLHNMYQRALNNFLRLREIVPDASRHAAPELAASEHVEPEHVASESAPAPVACSEPESASAAPIQIRASGPPVEAFPVAALQPEPNSEPSHPEQFNPAPHRDLIPFASRAPEPPIADHSPQSDPHAPSTPAAQIPGITKQTRESATASISAEYVRLSWEERLAFMRGIHRSQSNS